MEETRGISIKGLLVRLILIIIFIFLLIWLFPMPDLKPLNNQIFGDNIDRMRNVAKTYYTVDRLPKNINDSKRMTLQEMIDNKLILPLMDSNGKYCSNDESYVEITKLEDEYVIKVYLSCTDKKDYIIEHFGCYDICSDTCKLLETTTTTEAQTKRSSISTSYKPKKTSAIYSSTTKPRTTLTNKVTTSAVKKIYEYEFVQNVCKQDFDKYVCPVGYSLIEDSCVKETAEIVVKDAEEKKTIVTSTDTKDAEEKTIIVDENGNEVTNGGTGNNTEIINATCEPKEVTSTIDATASNVSEINATQEITTTTLTADAVTSTDTKSAYAETKTIYTDYVTAGSYDIITATKTATSYKWVADYYTISTSSNLAYVGENEKLEYVSSFEELECSTCFTTVKKYKYVHYTKQYTYEYTCPSGYSKYNNTYCKSNSPVSNSKVCPSGYSPSGDKCAKQSTYYNEETACKAYGSSYKFDSKNKTCVKTSTKYTCPKGELVNGKYCNVTETKYSCPAGYDVKSGDKTKCIKAVYSCPANTSIRTYTLNGTKCIMKLKVNVCTCPTGTTQSEDKKHCYKQKDTYTKKVYTCDSYPGYDLTKTDNGYKCVKTVETTKVVYSCEKYGNNYLLDSDKHTCTATVNRKDTIAAEKTYKVYCYQNYMWTTQTDVPGWSYTGNKREIK